MKLDNVQEVAVLLDQLRDTIEAGEEFDTRQRLAICYQSKWDSTAWRHIVDVSHKEAEALVGKERKRLEEALRKWGLEL